MPRLIRNSAVLAKIETTPGTDASPAGATDAVLVANLSINPLNAQNIDRALIRPFLGGSEMLIGPANVELTFEVEFVGSGTVATAPAWAALVRACAFAQTLTATTRADYTPISTGIESVTLYYYDDGVLHKLLMARGTFSVQLGMGGLPKLAFRFVGLDGGQTAATPSGVTYASFKQPQVLYDAASGDVTLGGTHNATAAPAFSGGTAYPSTGLSLEVGNEVVHNPFLGGESVDIVQRVVTGRIELVLTAAQEVSLIADAKAGTLRSVGLLHGTVANNKAGVFMPSCQLLNPGKGDRNGVRTVTFDIRALPVAGNDEVRLITSFA